MNTGGQAQNLGHDEVMLLLPWYVNGALEDSQRARLEEHVRSCIACRKEVVIERKMLEIFRESGPLDLSAQAGFDQLRARIANPASRLERPPARGDGLLGRWFGTAERYFAGMGLRPALQLASFAVLVLAAGLFTGRPLPQNGIGGTGVETAEQATFGYKTLSSTRNKVGHVGDIRVIFASGATAGSIGQLLEALPARVIAGPDSAGVYTVQLLGAADDSDRQIAILRLRERSDVIFAEASRPIPAKQPGEKPRQ